MITVEANARSASKMKPHMRTDQPKPKLLCSNIFPNAIGKTTPPRDDPAIAKPMAAPRFLLKYCGVADVAGVMIKPFEIPPRMP